MSILKFLFYLSSICKPNRLFAFIKLKCKSHKKNIHNYSNKNKRELNERYQLQSQAIFNLVKSSVFNERDLTVVIHAILKTGCNVLNVERASYWLFQNNQEFLNCELVYNKLRDEVTFEEHRIFKINIPIYFFEILNERVFVSNDVVNDEKAKEFLEIYSQKINLGALLDAPIRIGGKVVGVISLEEVGKPRVWQPDEIFFSGLLADYVALAMVSNEKMQQEEKIKNLNELYNKRIQEEKLASMSRFVYGIAHEINNPTGTIQATLDLIRSERKSLFDETKNLNLILTREEKSIVEDFFLQSIQTRYIPTGLERKKLKDSIQKELEKYSIPSSFVLADKCVDAGIYNFPAKYKEILQHPKAELILEFLIQNILIEKGFMAIESSIQRITNIIQNLKKYFHEDPKSRKILTSIEETIETTMILFYDKIKHKVEIIRKYQKVDMIYCYPDELIQLWTNLIQNALQAMDYQGILEIHIQEVYVENQNYIQVNIVDSGKGIPEEIQDRIFEPFFSTKAVGEGTGIGLDICRKIVNYHNGKIFFQSQPGRTVFTVLLPKTL